MQKPKTTQTLLHRFVFVNRKLIKFCYFAGMLLLFSCGDKVKNNANSVEKTESTEEKTADSTSKKTILFFGDSITAGYGLDDTNDSFPWLIQSKIDSLNLDYQVINSGLSGETSAGGKSRIDWILNQKIDVFVLELGANDGLRGVALTETKANLQAIIEAVKAKNSKTKIVLAGMQMPPNMGQDYASGFKTLFYDLAKENKLYFIPFILKDVGGIAALNQRDGIHPTKEGHKILATTVWETLEPILSSAK